MISRIVAVASLRENDGLTSFDVLHAVLCFDLCSFNIINIISDMAGGWRGGRRLLLLLLRLVPAALQQRCFQSPLLQGGADGDDKD